MADEAWHSYIVGEARDGVVRMYDEPIEIAPAKPVTPEEFMRDVTVDDLIAFLRARLDEREARALAASPGPWRPNAEHDEVLAVDDILVADGFALSSNQLRATVDHIAGNDPEYVLEDIAAKRQIIGWCIEVIGQRDLSRYGEFGALKDDPDALAVTLAVETLRLLALPYAGHEDYRAEWRPVD